MFSKKSLLVLVVTLIAVLIIGCSNDGDDLVNNSGETNGVAAVVNGVNISMEEFQDIVDKTVLSYQQQGFSFEGEEGEGILEEIQHQIINSLVQEEVLLQEATEKGYDVSEEVIEEEFEAIKTQFSTEEEFETALQANQLTENELRDMLAIELQIENFLVNQIEEVDVTEDEVKEMYDEYIVQLQIQLEGIEEPQELPTFEEIKDQIEAEIKHGKQQQQVGQIIEELMGKSEIQIFI